MVTFACSGLMALLVCWLLGTRSQPSVEIRIGLVFLFKSRFFFNNFLENSSMIPKTIKM